jgi:hypothetical protein
VVAHGIKTTAGVVTSAAIVMVGVLAIFAALQAMIFKQFGVGLAAAMVIEPPSSGDPAARVDEAARRPDLVRARMARLASSLGARRRCRFAPPQ